MIEQLKDLKFFSKLPFAFLDCKVSDDKNNLLLKG